MFSKANKGFWYNEKPETRFLKIDNAIYHPIKRDWIKCNECGTKVERPINKAWISQCPHCKTYINFFNPTPIQLIASLAQDNIIINLGAYGSGKTTISAFRISSQCRAIPFFRVMCFAQTLDQLKKNAISELEKFFHPSEIIEKKQDRWVLVNGSTVEFWASDDPDKIRSANVNAVWIVEGHKIEMKKIYNEALARIRNSTGFVYALDDKGNHIYQKDINGVEREIIDKVKNFIIVEANPVKGSWVNHEILSAHTIIHTKSVKGIEILKTQAAPKKALDIMTGDRINTDVIAIMNATIDNPTLPKEYMVNLMQQCKNEQDYNVKVYCDITSKEGLVFNDIVENPNLFFITNPEVPHTLNAWEQDCVFVEAFDLGGSNVSNDPDAYLLGIFNRKTKQLYITAELKQSGLNVDDSCKEIGIRRARHGWNKLKHYLFVADNAIARQGKRGSTDNIMYEYQLRLTTSITPCNNKNIDYGIKQVQQWIRCGALKFSSDLVELKKEMLTYETSEVARALKGSEEIVYRQEYTDINNHLIDALRYLVVTLENMGYRQDQAMIDYNRNLYNYKGEPIDISTKNKIDLLGQNLPEFLGGAKEAKKIPRIKL